MPAIRFLGHAAFRICFEEKTFLIDPFIDGNPNSPFSSESEITEADIILVTHDHYDHGFDDAIKIAKRTGATIVAVAELARMFREGGVKNVVSGNIGGTVRVGEASVTFFRAIHSSGVGAPCGFVTRYRDFSFYHAGDTAYFGDMALLAEENLDLAMLPIGGTYTMDIRDAVRAVDVIRPKTVIPMHFGTFPNIQADPDDFCTGVGIRAHTVILKPGETLSL